MPNLARRRLRQMRMTIQQDYAWPTALITALKLGCSTGHINGACTQLMAYCFLQDLENLNFMVTPDFIYEPDTAPTLRLVISDNDYRPFCFAIVKDESWAKDAELRYRADRQIREEYAYMFQRSPISRPWGISFLGTSIRIYSGKTESCEVNPPSIPSFSNVFG